MQERGYALSVVKGAIKMVLVRQEINQVRGCDDNSNKANLVVAFQSGTVITIMRGR